jgi:hypothetical protein
MPNDRDEDCSKSTIKGSVSPWGDACGFNAAVEALVEISKSFIVRAVAWLVNVKQ